MSRLTLAVACTALALTLGACGVTRWEPRDQSPDPVAQVHREMGGGGAHELAHVLHRRLALEARWLLVFAHFRPGYPVCYGYGALDCTGTSSVIWSSRAWAGTESCLSSPRIQTRL